MDPSKALTKKANKYLSLALVKGSEHRGPHLRGDELRGTDETRASVHLTEDF